MSVFFESKSRVVSLQRTQTTCTFSRGQKELGCMSLQRRLSHSDSLSIHSSQSEKRKMLSDVFRRLRDVSEVNVAYNSTTPLSVSLPAAVRRK